ncbi:MAG: transketolase [Bacteroidales bacterium]|nr:transketolase [Bacteroidales bacterium]MBO7647289.1 transketolase [Bacteroidales bacterium]
MEIKDLQSIASQVRRDVIRMVHGAQSGHPGGSLGCADFMTALYFEIMNIQPDAFTKEGVGEDMFFLSNGHISPVLYSVMARRGFFPVAELATFRKLHTRLQGHPTPVEGLPGVRVASGSLGQGVSVAIGAALAKKANQDPNLVFALTGDGELEEGQVWEAFMFAPNNKVDNLIVTIDYNGKQIDGPVDEVNSLGNLRAKLEAFNWLVLEMNGNDMKACVMTLNLAKKLSRNGKPIAIIMKTEMGMGVDFMMGTHKWHGSAPNDEQAEAALAQLPETLGDY